MDLTAGSPTGTELKLAVPAASRAKLAAHPLLATEAEPRCLVST